VICRDALRHVRDEQVLADPEAAPLVDVARHPLGRARRDRRAKDQRLALLQHRQQIVDHAPDLRDVDLDVHVGGRAEGEHDVVGAGGVPDRFRALEATVLEHPLEQVLRAGLVKWHPPGRDLLEHRISPLDADHLEPPVRERQRQRQAHPAETDDGDALRHNPVRPGTAWQTTRRSAGSC
jgi:hypothetical protein